jgi:2-keto-4-pentenoate hydratase
MAGARAVLDQSPGSQGTRSCDLVWPLSNGPRKPNRRLSQAIPSGSKKAGKFTPKAAPDKRCAPRAAPDTLPGNWPHPMATLNRHPQSPPSIAAPTQPSGVAACPSDGPKPAFHSLPTRAPSLMHPSSDPSQDPCLALAQRLLQSHDRAELLGSGDRLPNLSMAHAEAVQAQITERRRARAEQPRGWKIGFTNRGIWPIYGVDRPIWGPVWDRSVTLLAGIEARVEIGPFVQPRLEPEIVFGLRKTPADACIAALLDAVQWCAHGVEIVQSVYPDWRFTAAEAHAAQGLHAALLIGPRIPIAQWVDPAHDLSALELTLSCNAKPVACGRGADVLDGPLQALSHLVRELAKRGQQLAAGDVITTGTLTDAQPLQSGQHWQTQLFGVPLPGLSLVIA